MTNRKLSGRLISLAACALACLLAAGCKRAEREDDEKREHGPSVWFVHATDPHIFLPAAQDPDKDKKSTGDKQEKLNEKALADTLKRIGSLPEGDGPPSFLVLTGDFGTDPCPIAKSAEKAPATKPAPASTAAQDCVADEAKRKDQIERLSKALGASPVHQIYLVAGNNDVAHEHPGDAELGYFNKFMDEVQTKITADKSAVQLHNLTNCYASDGDARSCYADVAGTSYRLIGFPSFSFKNEDANAASSAAEVKQVQLFRGLVDQARQDNKKILILAHIPELDDPYILAQDRYTSKQPPKAIDTDAKNPRSAWSAWNASKKILDDWKDVLASDAVAGVLAGHLHDSHKEIYQPPYSWSTINDHRAAMSKLFLAPPLAVKKQDESPIQARGFSLVRLLPDRIQPLVYWYNQETGDFTAQAHPESEWERKHHGRWHWPRWIRWLWALADPQRALERMAVLLIAFLAAFLTVMHLWQIPPEDNPLARPANPGEGAAGGGKAGGTKAAGGAQANPPQPTFNPSPFASNLGKTVIAGLGGLAAETILQAWEGKPSGDDKEFYVVWFVIFFFVLLIGLAGLRGLGEAVRARRALIYYVWPRRSDQTRSGYWLLRFWRWTISLQVPLLTFLNTFLNLIQGKNQTMTRVFADQIIEQQHNVTHVANTIRQHLNEVILRRLTAKLLKQELDPKQVNPEHVRVNISVLSADQSNVFYIASALGSAITSFPKQSVAWVSVFAGKIRWHKRSYSDLPQWKEIVLLDNSDKVIPDEAKSITLGTHYQQRHGDYDAFVMFPVPWPQRGYGSEYVKGAIHISFRHQTQFDNFWAFHLNAAERRARAATKADNEIQAAATAQDRKDLVEVREQRIAQLIPAVDPDPVIDLRTYGDEEAERMLEDWCRDDEVRVALREAIVILGELLRGFNENIHNASSETGPTAR